MQSTRRSSTAELIYRNYSIIVALDIIMSNRIGQGQNSGSSQLSQAYSLYLYFGCSYIEKGSIYLERVSGVGRGIINPR